jgi:hypothetical protein
MSAADSDHPQTVPQPLHRGAGDENRAFQRVFDWLVADPPGDGGQQLFLAEHPLGSGVHQQERAGAVGVFGQARTVTGLAKQGCLLVTGDARHRNPPRPEKHLRVGFAVDAGRWFNFRQDGFWNLQPVENLLVPAQFLNVVEQGTRGVGVVGDVCLTAGQPPHQPAINGAESNLAPFGALA